MIAEATTGSGSPIAHSTFTGSALRCTSFLSTNSSYLNGIGVRPYYTRRHCLPGSCIVGAGLAPALVPPWKGACQLVHLVP